MVGTVWTLDILLEGETASSTANGGEPAMLTLDPDGGFNASTGCRAIDGQYSLDAGRLSLRFPVDEPAVDDQACEGPAGTQDPAVLTVLEQKLTVEVVGDRLTLSADDGTGLAYRSVESGSDG